jgi:hypothetical protein
MTIERAEVYWNFHKKLYSVRALTGESKGLVTCRTYCVRVADAVFAVQPAGRRKTLRDRRKNVHAFVRGRITEIRNYPGMDAIEYNTAPEDRDWESVRYNPYTETSFVTLGGLAVTRAAEVRCITLVDGTSRLYARSLE